MSDVPPGTNGTMNRIGLLGQLAWYTAGYKKLARVDAKNALRVSRRLSK